MLTLTSTLTEERKQEIINDRKDPGHSMPNGLLQNGNEYYLKIKVTDSIAAENLLVGLIHCPEKTMEGREHLGFELQQVSWDTPNDLFVQKLDIFKEELGRFVQNELLQRVSERGESNI